MDSNDPNNPNAIGSTPVSPAAPPSWEPTQPSSLPDLSQGTPTAIPATPNPSQLQPSASPSPWDAPIAQAPAPELPQQPASPWPAAPETANPFLQPQNGTGFSMPEVSPVSEAPAAPNPFASTTTDPLNTAFAPTSVPSENPFAQQAPAPALPDLSQPQAPGAPNPWDQAPAPAETSAPDQSVSGFATTPADAGNPILNPVLNLGQPGNPSPEPAQIMDQSIPESGAAVSSISPEQPQASANPLPDINPAENAPTDLSHLIAGDETTPQQTNGMYTPPTTTDQNPPIPPAQTEAADGQTPPPGKHLNLTKVLLVAGIPIILIVAALSAYLILGVGKSAPATDQTSLPVEQTKQNQAPLTNPPAQIVAPSPVTIPEPSVADSSLPLQPSPSPSPEASLSPAMRAAQQKASASPTASTSPAASASTSLPN